MAEEKGNLSLAIVVVVCFTIVIAIGLYLIYDKSLFASLFTKEQEKPVACTQEAKICPDGSSVGRTGPNCEFAVCPAVKTDETANWQTYKNDQYGFEFKYPENGYVKTSHDWSPLFWPPEVKVASINQDPVKVCPISTGGYYEQLKSSLTEVNINNTNFPLYKLSYNGTKSGFIRYCYIIKKDKNYYILHFETQSSTDVDHTLEKEVDIMTQRIISTFRFTK